MTSEWDSWNAAGPWYPDGDGWVEYGGSGEMPAELHRDSRCQVLTMEEREIKRFVPLTLAAMSWSWGRKDKMVIVAWRKIGNGPAWPIYSGWKPDEKVWYEAEREAPSGVGSSVRLEILMASEAEAKRWKSEPQVPERWTWGTEHSGRIVAWRFADE